MSDNVLEPYAAWLESVADAVPPGLDALVTVDVHFRDPFNDLRGIEAYRRVLEETVRQVRGLEFHITHAGMVSSRQDDDPAGLLLWRLRGRLAAFGDRAWDLAGCSELRFDHDGRVREHVDHWDAAAGLYEHVPLLGRCLRALRAHIAID